MARTNCPEKVEAQRKRSRSAYERQLATPEGRTRRKENQKRSYEQAKREGRCVICRTAAATVGLNCVPCSERKKKRIRGWIQKVRLECYAAYGGAACACCGETTLEFLSLDHVNGGGTRERKENPTGGANVYTRLRNQGYPPGFQVLCFNCNWGRHRNGGVCPHKLVPQCRKPS